MYPVLELHKEIFQGLQTVDAFSQDMFLAEEFDFHLNKQQDTYVNELLDDGFADRQVKLDHIQDLVVKNKSLPVFNSPSSFYYEVGAIVSYLPGNYKHLLTSRAKVRNTLNCASLVESMVDYTQTFHFLELKTDLSSGPYFSKVELISMLDGLETVIASVSIPVQEKEDTHTIVQNILFQANKKATDINVYWEKYTTGKNQGIVKLGHFIIHDDNFPTPTTTVGYKIRTYQENGTTLDVETFETFAPSIVKVWNTDEWDSETTLVSASQQINTVILDNKDLYNRRTNAFFLSKANEPHTNISDGLIFTYYGDKFLIEQIVVDYIREPQPISLSANQGCELSDSAARLVANRVIEYLKLVIENPNYKEVVGHNEIRGQQ